MIATPKIEPKSSADGSAEERQRLWFRTTRIELVYCALVCSLKGKYVSRRGDGSGVGGSLRRAILSWGTEERCLQRMGGKSYPCYGGSFFLRTPMRVV